VSQTVPSRRKVSNGRVAAICALVTAGMVGAGFAAVPLYRAFCQATGFEGTIGRANAAPTRILDKTISVRFDTNTRDVPWTFKPEQVSQTVRVGATALTHFTVTNNSDEPITGQASFNLLPETAGAYFKKIECFCFKEQTLHAHQTVEYAVVYFVDPKIETDPETRGVPELTLSYTFYPSQNGAIQQAKNDAATRPLGEQPKAGL